MIKIRSLAISGCTLALAAATGAFMQQNKSNVQVASAGTVMSDAMMVASAEVGGDSATVPMAHSMSGPETSAPGQSFGDGLELTEIKLTSSFSAVSSGGLQSGVQPGNTAGGMNGLMVPSQPGSGTIDTQTVTPSGRDQAGQDQDGPVLVAAAPDIGENPRAALSAPQVQQGCAVDLTGELRASAMVALHLSAPCQPNARAVIHHTGMMFSIVTDENGEARLDVPALTERAVFLAMMNDGNGGALEIDVNTVELYDRSVVQWRGVAGLGLHALEFGADYGSQGHVWSGAPRDPDVASAGEGGFVVQLGDAVLANGHMAEVYTFPVVTARDGGDVEINVEIEVSDLNCGRDIEGETIQVSRGAQPRVSELSVTMPDCDAVGDILLLKNLVNDLKIASK